MASILSRREGELSSCFVSLKASSSLSSEAKSQLEGDVRVLDAVISSQGLFSKH